MSVLKELVNEVVVIVVAVIVVAGDIDVVVVFRALAWKTCLAFAKESVARKWIRLDF